jgi:hypothetical protein
MSRLVDSFEEVRVLARVERENPRERDDCELRGRSTIANHQRNDAATIRLAPIGRVIVQISANYALTRTIIAESLGTETLVSRAVRSREWTTIGR